MVGFLMMYVKISKLTRAHELLRENRNTMVTVQTTTLLFVRAINQYITGTKNKYRVGVIPVMFHKMRKDITGDIHGKSY